MFTILPSFLPGAASPALQCYSASHQGHVGAAGIVGYVYHGGLGVAVDYPRAMATYKLGAERGDANFQYMIGMMYYYGQGVDVDYKQARAWLEKAVAQDYPSAFRRFGSMYYCGDGVTPSWRRARGYFERAIELGDSMAVNDMQNMTENTQHVMSQRSIHYAPSPFLRDLVLPNSPLPLPHTRRSAPSWTSGWRSTARAGGT
jgi:TPR repeat protein